MPSTELDFTKLEGLVTDDGITVELTDEFKHTLEILENTDKNVFVGGRAGSGKSTLLKIFRENTKKNIAILAPTGIAALNVMGQTIHSFFRFGINVTPDNLGFINSEKDSVYDVLDTLVIDEVSMVRADMMDIIDKFLRRARKCMDVPFGGVQMVFFGDLFQLPPIVLEKDEQMFYLRYTSPYFFHSKVYPTVSVANINLTHIFRQKDDVFIKALNAVRENNITDEDLEILNSRYGIEYDEKDNYIYVTTTNKRVTEINESKLKELKGKLYSNKAYIFGNFEEKYFPTDEVLKLKIGAQVMFLINDREGRYVNGTLGTIGSIKEGYGKVKEIVVTTKGKGFSEDLIITPYKWRTYRYVVNDAVGDESPKLELREDGTFTQFPLKLSWANTIHKCVSEGTLIPTNKGILRIKDIVNQGNQKHSDLKVFGVRNNTAVSEFFKGTKELGYKITTNRGYEIICSERHPLRVIKDGNIEWVKAPELGIGDTVQLRVGTKGEGNIDISKFVITKSSKRHKIKKLPKRICPDLAWLLGILIGDGCVSDKRDGRCDITSQDIEVIYNFKRIVKDIFGIKTTIVHRVNNKASVVYFHSLDVREFLLFLGLGYATANNKVVPYSIFQTSLACQKAFLRGLFDTDGGVNVNGIHFTSTSERLCKEIQIVLANLGITASIYFMPPKVAIHHHAWRVNITGQDTCTFMHQIGFTVVYKTCAGKVLAKKSQKTPIPRVGCMAIPTGDLIAKNIRTELLTKFGKKYGNKVRLHLLNSWADYLSRTIAGHSPLTHVHLKKLAQIIPEVLKAGNICEQWFGDSLSGVFNDQIKSIVREYAIMYDICVPEGNAFVGNVFINHNSQGKTFDRVVLDISGNLFANGQLYVALSRCKTLGGLILKCPVNRGHVQTSPFVKNFMANVVTEAEKV